MNIPFELIKSGHLGTRKNEVPEPAVIPDLVEDIPELVETNGRQFPLHVPEHADGALVVAAEPDGNDAVRTEDHSFVHHASHSGQHPPSL